MHHATPQAQTAPRPRVSVVIPARNAARTLEQTLQSLVNQSLTDWQAIVIDDGSTDNTAELIRQWSARDARIQGISGAAKGVSAARNAGLRASCGPLVAFLDADDLWLPSKLSTHLDHFQRRPEIGLSFDRILFVDAEGRSTGVESTTDVTNLAPSALLYENPACTASTLVIRREALEAIRGFDESMRFAEDLELMIRLRCTTSWLVEGLPQVLTHYRASPSGASAGLAAMQLGWESLINKVSGYAPAMVEQHFAAAKAVHLRYLARRALRLNLPASTGLALLAQAVRSHPWVLMRQPRRSLGTLTALLASCLAGALRPTAPR